MCPCSSMFSAMCTWRWRVAAVAEETNHVLVLGADLNVLAGGGGPSACGLFGRDVSGLHVSELVAKDDSARLLLKIKHSLTTCRSAKLAAYVNLKGKQSSKKEEPIDIHILPLPEGVGVMLILGKCDTELLTLATGAAGQCQQQPTSPEQQHMAERAVSGISELAIVSRGATGNLQDAARGAVPLMVVPGGTAPEPHRRSSAEGARTSSPPEEGPHPGYESQGSNSSSSIQGLLEHSQSQSSAQGMAEASRRSSASRLDSSSSMDYSASAFSSIVSSEGRGLMLMDREIQTLKQGWVNVETLEFATNTDIVWGKQGFRCTKCSRPPVQAGSLKASDVARVLEVQKARRQKANRSPLDGLWTILGRDEEIISPCLHRLVFRGRYCADNEGNRWQLASDGEKVMLAGGQLFTEGEHILHRMGRNGTQATYTRGPGGRPLPTARSDSPQSRSDSRASTPRVSVSTSSVLMPAIISIHERDNSGSSAPPVSAESSRSSSEDEMEGLPLRRDESFRSNPGS